MLPLFQFLYEDSVVMGKMWNSTCVMDQEILDNMVRWAKFPKHRGGLTDKMKATLYSVDKGGESIFSAFDG